MKQTLLDFSFSLFKKCFKKKQKMVAAEEQENEKEVSLEEDGRAAKDVSLGASVLVPPVSQSSKLRG